MDASMIKGVNFRNMFSILGQRHGGRNYALQYKYCTSIPLGISRGKKTWVLEQTDTKLSCNLEPIINLFDLQHSHMTKEIITLTL